MHREASRGTTYSCSFSELVTADNKRTDFKILIAGFTAVVVIMIACLAYYSGSSYAHRQLRADSNSLNYADETSSRIEDRCAEFSDNDLFECVKLHLEDVHEFRLNEYDLSAQQDMSDWAFWMMWISAGSTIVTSIGAVLSG